MKTIKMQSPDGQKELAGLRAALGLDQGLVAEWQRKLSDGRTPLENVREVLAAVRERGDEAVIAYTEKFDRVRLSAQTLRVPQEEIDAAVAATPVAVIEALRQAAANIRRFQAATMADDPEPVVSPGRRLAMVYRPLRRVGVYVPGGATAYPSSVLMTVVPAQVAGVEEVVVVSPPAEGGRIRSLVLAACGVAGVTEVYRLGGATAVAALATPLLSEGESSASPTPTPRQPLATRLVLPQPQHQTPIASNPIALHLLACTQVSAHTHALQRQQQRLQQWRQQRLWEQGPPAACPGQLPPISHGAVLLAQQLSHSLAASAPPAQPPRQQLSHSLAASAAPQAAAAVAAAAGSATSSLTAMACWWTRSVPPASPCTRRCSR